MISISDPLSLTLPSLNEWRESVKRDEYSQDPARWVREVLKDHLWSKQVEIMNSVRDHRRTAVQSSHSIGKSFTAARVVAWWLSSHEPGTARVITSAPTGDQVKAILWHEIARAYSSGNLPGRLNQTEWWMTITDENGRTREELVGIGRKPAEHNPSAFQGIHERYVLVLLDEAGGIPKSLWDAADGLLSNDDCRLLSIGNPDDPTSEFANECKPGSGANVIQISAFDTPNFTGEEIPEHISHRLVGRAWVEEKKKRWGENNPLYISKVLGQFPEVSTDGLIPISWIRAAQERTLEPSLPVELGVDVGGGGNKNIIAVRKGPVVRIDTRDQNPNTMQTLSNVLNKIKEHGATKAKVDDIGIGHGAVDRAKEMAEDQRVKTETPDLARRAGLISGVNVGMPAEDSESFVNLRAEGYWTLRERFQEGSIDIDKDDEDLVAQLVALKYKRSGGRIQIESKEDMRRRGVESPDDADGVMLAFLPDQEREISVSVTWGGKKVSGMRR